jgi:hypothetical protein
LFRLWIGLILFSQTALAGRLADSFFSLFVEPGPPSAEWLHFLAQKSYHVLLFGGMGALLALRTKLASKAEVVAWCVGFGCFAESLQLLAPNRSPSPWDAMLNITASLGFYALASAQAGGRDSRRRSAAPPPR